MIRNEQLTAAQSALHEGNFQQAEILFRDVLDKNPKCVHALSGLGILHCQAENPAVGIEFFMEALRQIPSQDLEFSETELRQVQATLCFQLGVAQRLRGNREEAIEAFRTAWELAPTEGETLINLAQLQFEAERHQEAAESFRKLTALQPENASAWLTLGYILALQDQFADSIPPLEEACRLDPTSPDACFFLAESLRKVERFEDSLPYYQRMLQVAMEWPQAVHGYGKTLIPLGHLEDGWDAMEFRLGCTFGSWVRHALPNWEGVESDDQTILAYSEDGTAADLLYASCLPDLIHRVGHVVVECEPSLHGLFRRSFPRATVVPLTPETVKPDHNPWGLAPDEQIAMGSLPRFFRRQKEDFPKRKVYLVADNDRVEKWTTRLSEIGAVPKIGVLWQGTWTSETEKQTALPMFDLRNLMLRNQANAAWVCLQHGSKQKDIDQYRRNVSLQIRLYPEAFQYDLDEMAGLLSSLDLVLTPPGYVAHLAAALGARTWVVLPAAADWRWALGTLWHPTVKLFRQKIGQRWADVFQEIHTELNKFLASYIPPSDELPITLPFPEPKTLRLRRTA